MRIKISKTSVVLMVAVIVVGTASAIVAYILSTQQPQDTSETAIVESSPTEQKAIDASSLASSGKVDEAVKSIDASIAGASSDADKAIYYSTKATILFNANKLDQALVVAIQTYNARRTAGSAAFVGQVAYAQGNTAVATEYYTKAIQLIDKGSAMADEDKKYYQAQIDAIKSGTPYEK